MNYRHNTPITCKKLFQKHSFKIYKHFLWSWSCRVNVYSFVVQSAINVVQVQLDFSPCIYFFYFQVWCSAKFVFKNPMAWWDYFWGIAKLCNVTKKQRFQKIIKWGTTDGKPHFLLWINPNQSQRLNFCTFFWTWLSRSVRYCVLRKNGNQRLTTVHGSRLGNLNFDCFFLL